jgi:transposase
MTPRLIRRPDWKEIRRLQAPYLKNEDCIDEEIVESFGVTKAAVSKLMKAMREGGEDAGSATNVRLAQKMQ